MNHGSTFIAVVIRAHISARRGDCPDVRSQFLPLIKAFFEEFGGKMLTEGHATDQREQVNPCGGHQLCSHCPHRILLRRSRVWLTGQLISTSH